LTPDERTRITIETERIMVITGQHATRGWCKECGRLVELLPHDQAQRLVQAGPLPPEMSQDKLHVSRTKNGLVVCLKSMLRLMKATRTWNTPR